MKKIFIPKLAQNEAGFVKDKKIPAVFMDAYIVAKYKKPAEIICSSSELFIVDPNTNYFISTDCKKIKKSFNKLETAPEEYYKVDELLTDEGTRKYKFVKESIDYQVKHKFSLIILPYLYSDSIEDTRFGLNLTMISDGLRLVEDEQVKSPVYAMINLGNEVLNDYQKLDYLIERYSGDFNERIEGYFIMIDQFDCRKASEGELLGLAHLTFHLSENKKVYLLKMGDYGELLSCVGASGYSSSLGGGETFNATSLIKKIPGFGRNHSQTTYVPELFNYLNDEALKKIGYKCSCSICNKTEGLPNGVNNTKAHFLELKLKAMEELNAVKEGDRNTYLRSKLEQAIELANQYNSDFALSIKTDFLIRWKNILDKSRHWRNRDRSKDEIDLDNIIEEARNNK